MRRLRFFLLVAVSAVLGFSGCGGGGVIPGRTGPVSSYGGLPDLSGIAVLVFPVQSVVGRSSAADVGRELQFAFNEAGLGDRWVLEDELRRQVDRSPQVNVDLDQLPIGHFLQREVRRVGDPLFGQFRRLSALADTRYVFVPIVVRFEEDEVDHEVGQWGLTGTVVEGTSGRVLWFGTLMASPGRADSPSALAELAAYVVQRLAPRAVENSGSAGGDAAP